MKIKSVKNKDLSKIYNIEREVFKEDAFSKDLIQKLIRENFLFYKLEKSGLKKVLIGFVIIIKDRSDRVNIINIVINPKFQNMGYGTLLMKKTLERIKQIQDIKIVLLNVKIINNIAIHLYEKFKFEIVKKIDNYYQSGQSSYEMQLKIDPCNKKSL